MDLHPNYAGIPMLDRLRLRTSLGAIGLVLLAAATADAQSRRSHAVAPAVDDDGAPLLGGCGAAHAERDVAMTSDPTFGLGSARRWFAPVGEVRPPNACPELFTPSRLDAGASLRTHGGIRGVFRAGLIGAGAGAVVGGLVEIFEPNPEFIDVWPTTLAIPGFLVGLVVGLVL